MLLSTHLKALGALVSVEHTNIKSKILDALDVHKNILQLSVDGKITLMKPVIANVETINVTKLKGHNLSTNTLRNSVPAFSLQIYCNPCLRWLIQPAFVLLVVKSMKEKCFSSGESFLCINYPTFHLKKALKDQEIPNFKIFGANRFFVKTPRKRR